MLADFHTIAKGGMFWLVNQTNTRCVADLSRQTVVNAFSENRNTA